MIGIFPHSTGLTKEKPINTPVYMYIYIYIYIYMYLYIYMCVCVCVCVCIHTKLIKMALLVSHISSLGSISLLHDM